MVPYGQPDRGDGVALRSLLFAALGTAGLAACVTLLFLGMRAVMDVGGACADGGPYVSAQSCPNGAPGAMLLGVFGLFGFGAIAMLYGPRVGGIWAAIPLLAWCGLFLSLGWNFLDYGVFNPPPGAGVEAGWLIPGVLFVLMGGVPLAGILVAARSGSLAGSAILASFNLAPGATGRTGRSGRTGRTGRSGRTGPTGTMPQALPHAEVAGSLTGGDAADGLDGVRHLERLAELRKQGLLTDAEYETAKTAVLRDMEDRP